MCRIEQFGLVYPDGNREGREQVVPCPWGTRSQPCRHFEIVSLGDRFVSASDLRPPIQPHIVTIQPEHLESSRLRPSSRGKPRDPIEGISLNFKFWNPFSSKDKEKKKKPQYYFVRKTKKQEPRPAVIQHQPPIPPPPETHFVPPVRRQSPVVVPIQPSHNHITHQPPGREPRRTRRVTPIVVHQLSEEDENESSSPPEASREHGRRTRSLSPISRYHIEKELIRQRELEQRRERIRREEREARERADRLAVLERQRAREEQRERREQIRQERREAQQRQRLAVEREARRQQEERNREHAARLQEREVRRQQEERNRERAARLQEREDLARLRAAEARQQREERARRYQEEEDIARRRAAERDRLWRIHDEQARRQYEEEQRYARARQANIPRHPRHPVFVHQDEDHLDRGERFIQEAIRAENLRQFERRARWPRGGYDDGALRRRNTVDGGQRWYGGDHRRRDRR